MLIAAYACYVAASLVSAIAPNAAVLLVARSAQGVANAFVTPVLIATLAGLVPRERLGRKLGVLGSFQAFGQAFAPLIGGVAAEVGWRWAFVATAVAAGVLVVVTPRGETGSAGAPARLRAVLRPGVLLAAAAACATWLTATGLMVIASLRSVDAFGLPGSQRGLLLAGFGVAGLVVGGLAGALIDRVGARRSGVLFGLLLAAAAALGGVAHVAVLASSLAVAGAMSTALRATTSLLAIRAGPDNQAGAVSVVLSLQFVGAAVAPLVCLPAYQYLGGAAFPLIGAGGLVAAAVLGALGRPRGRVRHQVRSKHRDERAEDQKSHDAAQ